MSSLRQHGYTPEFRSPTVRPACDDLSSPYCGTILDTYLRKRFTLHRHVVLPCLKMKKTTKYRDLVDELIEMPRIRDALNLDSIPAPSILCKVFDSLSLGGSSATILFRICE